MNKKDNFNQAVFDMFGVGKSREEMEEQESAASTGGFREARTSDAWFQPDAVAQPTRVEETVSSPVAPMNASVVSAPVNTTISAPVSTPISAPIAAPVVGPTVAPFSVVAATYIAPGTIVEGNIRCKGDIEIAGELRGNIESEGDVTVRTNIKGNIKAVNLRVIDCRIKGDSKVTGSMHIDVTSIVEGQVEASDLICSGILRGDSRVANNITLDASAKVFGNIETDTMSMERGASISGGLVMGKHWDDSDEPVKEVKKPAAKTSKTTKNEKN